MAEFCGFVYSLTVALPINRKSCPISYNCWKSAKQWKLWKLVSNKCLSKQRTIALFNNSLSHLFPHLNSLRWGFHVVSNKIIKNLWEKLKMDVKFPELDVKMPQKEYYNAVKVLH